MKTIENEHSQAKKNNKDDLINKVRIAQKVSRDRHIILKEINISPRVSFGRTKKD